MDQQIGEGEICCVFHASLEPLNKASIKLKNNYHVKFIGNVKELSIQTKGYINMEKANTLKNSLILILETKAREE